MKTMKSLFAIALLLCSVLGAKAQEKTSYYDYWYWTNNNTKVVYITDVFSYQVRSSNWSRSEYYDEIKGAFIKYLEARDNVREVWNGSARHSNDESKRKVEDDRLALIARYKRDGYSVYTSYFTWRPEE